MTSVRRRRSPRGSGDQLRDEILDAATELLLESGSAKDVSIRSVSQRVGITPPSIYLHFADKDTLLDAVCGRYFERLDDVMQQVAAEQPTTIDRLRAQGLAYVRFARQNPELYRIAMMSEGHPGSDVDQALNTGAFVHMRDSVQALMDEGGYPRGDATAAALIAACTSRAASSTLRLASNMRNTDVLFSLLVELIVSMPGIWPRCRSSGAATVEAITSAVPPGWFALTKIAGNSRFGNALMPSRK